MGLQVEELAEFRGGLRVLGEHPVGARVESLCPAFAAARVFGARSAGQDAGEGVHADMAVSPAVHRLERVHMAVLELSEGDLDVGLGAVGTHDLGLCPVVLVGNQDPFAERRRPPRG